MIMDELLEFCDATSLSTAGTGRALIGDVVDLQGGRDIGAGEDAYLVIQVNTAPTSGGAATVAFEFVSDAQAALATDGTATTHWTSGAIAIAALTVGRRFVVPLPAGTAYERYMGLLQNVATAALTAGKIDAFITRDKHAGWVAVADATQ
jgi:hypothetical protein